MSGSAAIARTKRYQRIATTCLNDVDTTLAFLFPHVYVIAPCYPKLIFFASLKHGLQAHLASLQEKPPTVHRSHQKVSP